METQLAMKKLWQLAENKHSSFKFAIISAVIGVLCGMIPYFAVSQIIIALFHGNTSWRYYLSWTLIAFAGYAGKVLLYAAALSTSHKATFQTLKEIREKILAKLPKMPLGTMIDTSSGELKQVIVDQVESMEVPLAHLLPEMTSNIVGPICIFIYLLVLDWRMALLSLVSIVIGFAIMSMIMKNYAADYAGSVKVNREMNATIVEYIGGIEVIKAFNQGASSYAKFADRIFANASYFYQWMKKTQINMGFYRAVTPTTLITILPVGWWFYLNGSLSVEVFVTVIILSLGIAGPILAAMNFTDSLARVGTVVGAIDAILEGEEQIHGTKEVVLPHLRIALDHVSFSYHEGSEILHGVTMDIPEGKITALVGPSGSGKSTIAKLIAGYWDVSQGNIKIGETDLKQIPLEQLYDLVAFVSQDNFLFDESIRENIRMGNLAADDNQVEAAAKAAGCHDFIMEMENGYETIVGTGGGHISGGERQRIAIARAMLKDAPMIILDEATAYIDPENEVIVQRAIAKLIADKTVIIIAHRLSTITDADQIFVIDHGKVSCTGTHESLLADSDLYRNMWQAHMGTKDGVDHD